MKQPNPIPHSGISKTLTMVNIPGYDGLYVINEIGEVFQTEKTIRRMPGLVKPQRTKQGYLQVQLVKGLDRKFFYVHRLVALAFIPNPDNKKQVNHINGDKKDNRLENLEWSTSKENVHHCHLNDLKKRKIKFSEYATIIRLREGGMSLVDLSNIYSVSDAYISNIVNRRTRMTA